MKSIIYPAVQTCAQASSYPGCGCWGTVWGRRCPAGWVWPGPPLEPRPCSRPPPPCPHTPTAPSAPAPTPGGEEGTKTVRKIMDSIVNCVNLWLTMSRIYFLGLPIISLFPTFLATYYIFRGIVGALGGSADGVGRHAPLLLMTSRCLCGALGGTLLADGVLEAWDGHVICTVMKDTEILLTLRRHTLDFAFHTLQTFPSNTVQCKHSRTMLPPSGQYSFLPLHVPVIIFL